MYLECKIYGPYLRKDGRKHIVLIRPDKTKTTVSYPKYLMECHLGRYLEPNETVDHIDCDFTNNAISNLRVMDRAEHAQDDVKRYKPQTFTCYICANDFTLSGQKLHDAIFNRKAGKAGPFCGKSCAGKYSTLVQYGKINKLKVNHITPDYTTNKSLRSLQEETLEVDTAKTGKP